MKIRDILREFAPDSGGDGGGDDGFSEETLKRLAAAWYNGDEDPRVEQTLMAAGWEIGQDEGYDDEPGVFVVQAGDVNGHSFISWPANELQQGVAEGHADQQRKIFKKNGQPVGEVGIDRESSPGVGQYYMKHYASGKDLSGFDNFEEAVQELRHLTKQGVREDRFDLLYRLERLDPQTRRVLTRMADHKEPGSWLSASEAYALTLGLQYKSRDPRGWEREVQHYVDLWREITGKKK